MQRTREEWAALVAAFEESGDTVARFCDGYGVNPRTFAWWRWQLRGAPRSRRRAGVTLLPVHVAAGATGTGCIVAALPGLELRFDVGADVDYVAALVSRFRGS